MAAVRGTNQCPQRRGSAAAVTHPPLLQRAWILSQPFRNDFFLHIICRVQPLPRITVQTDRKVGSYPSPGVLPIFLTILLTSARAQCEFCVKATSHLRYHPSGKHCQDHLNQPTWTLNIQRDYPVLFDTIPEDTGALP